MSRVMKNRLQHALRHCVTLKRQAEKQRNHGFIYVARCGEFLKVGIAGDVERRMSTMKVGNPYPVDLLMHWCSVHPKWEERQLHIALSDHWHQGEWFRANSESLAILAACG